MRTIELHPTPCAICGTAGNATERYPARFDADSLNPAVFSARRLPDRLHYRIVRCNTCGLVRSDPIVDDAALAHLYARSSFDYGEVVANLKHTYGRYLRRLERYGAPKGSLLEIGCGNGFFLEEALDQGYGGVAGVEPSRGAIERASPRVAPQVVCAMMRPGLFDAERFDVVCLFQVLDHVAAPAELLSECLTVTRPGGYILCLNHNVRAVSAAVLRERSPIIDIEHTYLYDKRTMRRLFALQGWRVKEVGAVFNQYTLRYLAHLLPLPAAAKQRLLGTLEGRALGSVQVTVPLGNLYLIAQKPRKRAGTDGRAGSPR